MNGAVLLLGGQGERFSTKAPKQFIDMGGKPLFLYAAKALEASPSIDLIVYVCPSGYLDLAKNLLVEKKLSSKESFFIEGGKSRQESCLLALKFLKGKGFDGDSVVLVADGDRPNLLERYLEENTVNAKEHQASVTATPSSDSVAISKLPSLVDGYIPRDEVYLIATPQAFNFSLLFEAELEAEKDGKKYTDEGSLVLSIKKVAPRIVEGERNNIKITVPGDLALFLGGQKNA